ncbi:unnamed protein product [Symbiodinium natans]|uniref:Actin-related protein 2/3 complex subunit 5 n=1 Tax=Symbiodinium natans TaxID=878477 RepID=A0A812P4M9_9DINO|nr:unnamed protein product [Symbiodinium natans]
MADVKMTPAPPSEEDWQSRCARCKATVEGLLKNRQTKEALAEALKEPPYGATVKTREDAARTVLQAMSAFREAEIKAAAASLSEEAQNTLMKYLYKFWGQSLPARTNSQLFTWHSALVELQAGPGSIVRAIYDWNWP